MVCNSGVGLTPIVADEMHWFGVVGLANGLAVLGDEETSSVWDHITGEAFVGPLTGERLDVWPLRLSTASIELERDSSLFILRQSDRWTLKRFWQSVPTYRTTSRRKRFPPGFRRTLSAPVDARLPAFESGLGVINGERARFYPFAALPAGTRVRDQWRGRSIELQRSLSGEVSAQWVETDEPPKQLLTRWYGFSFTYPDCSVYRAERGDRRSTT